MNDLLGCSPRNRPKGHATDKNVSELNNKSHLLLAGRSSHHGIQRRGEKEQQRG